MMAPVFERFNEALLVMNAWIQLEKETGRCVKVGRVGPFEGMEELSFSV